MVVILNKISFRTDNIEAIAVEQQKKNICIHMYTHNNKFCLYSVDNLILEDNPGSNCIDIVKYFYDKMLCIEGIGSVDLKEHELSLSNIIEAYHNDIHKNVLYNDALKIIEEIKLSTGEISEDANNKLRQALIDINIVEQKVRQAAYKNIDNLFDVI